MKSEDAIRARLKKLRLRYARKHVEASQKRKHQNCAHNMEMTPLDHPPQVLTEVEMAPRMSRSLVIFQPDVPVRLCAHGMDDPSSWNGDICDSDDTAKDCKTFRPRVSVTEAESEFHALMEDDAHVLGNFKDIASLQWVLEDRVHEMDLSWLERLILWMSKLARPEKRTPRLSSTDIPKGMWDDNSENTGK